MSDRTQNTNQLQTDIERRLANLDANLELVALERPGGDLLRLYIDHPDGVGLDRCERVTAHLRDLLADYALEVSSPGLDRPLTKPAHYERFAGHTIRVRTAATIDGQRTFTGRLETAGPDSITVEAGDGPVEIAFDRIHRSNLVPELSEVQS